jgi:hypothetical protein
MQTIDNEERQIQEPPVDSQSQPFPPIPLTQEEDEDDPEIIFAKAVAEIDTQPLAKKPGPYSIVFFLQDAFCLTMILLGLGGIIWQCITYPHILVVLYTKATPASITTTLDLPTRTLAPITLTRSATLPTTGTGYQKARAATGQVTFYNGLSIEQSVPAGTLLTGNDGESIRTDQTANIPPNVPPEDGYTTVPAHALHEGANGNIAAYDVSLALSSSLTVKNLAAFTGGRDARTFKAVAPQDLTTLTTTVSATVTQAFTTAFTLQPGEEAIPTNCKTLTTSNHKPGEEAQTVTLTIARTCSALAYDSQQLNHFAAATFMKTRPGTTYHIVGSIQTRLLSVFPLTIAISGKWAYTFSQDYQDALAQAIQGDTPAKAKAYLLKIGAIAYASIPSTLPAAMYINFLVFVG